MRRVGRCRSCMFSRRQSSLTASDGPIRGERASHQLGRRFSAGSQRTRHTDWDFGYCRGQYSRRIVNGDDQRVIPQMREEPKLVNPPQRAVALAYSGRDSAPRVVATGIGHVAEQIIRRAKEAGVFVHGSPELVGLLVQLNLDDHIPPELYLAIAEILAWVHTADQRAALGE
ncbi:MAG: EscU/YscU/HrcU family type III secretion system export apparatus switch protein [Burkholderiales bacterium]